MLRMDLLGHLRQMRAHFCSRGGAEAASPSEALPRARPLSAPGPSQLCRRRGVAGLGPASGPAANVGTLGPLRGPSAHAARRAQKEERGKGGGLAFELLRSEGLPAFLDA